MAGTGLPIPKPTGVLAQAPSLNADALSSAAAWGKIAAAGEEIARAGLDTMQRDVHLQQAGATADFEEKWRKENVEARDRFARDPEGFKKWAEASRDGALGQVPGWMGPHAKDYLNRTFDGTYATLLTEKRHEDDRLATNALTARQKSADDDVMALASAGKVRGADGQPDPEFSAALTVHDDVLRTAVDMGRMSPEMADYLRADLQGRAQGEMAARDALSVYREKGFDAAVEHLTKNVRENDSLSLKPAQRDKIFNRGLAAIRLEQARDKEDRGAAVEMSKDLRARLDSNQDIDPGEVRAVSDELARTGAFTERRNLIIRAGIHDATAAYRPGGGKTLPQLGIELARMRGELSPGLMGATEAAAFRRGVDPNYLSQVAIRESGGDVNARNPNSTATGPFQFVEQTWLAEVKRSGAAIGLGDLAAKIETDGGRYIVRDPEVKRQILALRSDAAVSADMAASLTAANAQSLKASLGRDPTPGDLYTAHVLGAGGAATMIKADRGARAADIDPAAAASNHSLFYTKDGRPKTVGELLDNLGRAPEAPDQSLGNVTKGVQQFYVAQERKVWPQMKSMLERGELTDPSEFEAVRYAASISGDTAWATEVETFAKAQGYGRLLKDAPEGTGQAVLDRMRARMEAEGATVSNRQVYELVQKQFERQQRLAREDPIGLAIETTPGIKPPAPLDFTNPRAAQQGLADRVTLARRTAVSKDTPIGSPLRPADRASTAAAITYGPVDQATAAFDMLASAPDDALLPTLTGKEIKEAVAGAVRSTSPDRYNAAMTFLDRIWQRAPESVDNLFGTDAVHELAAWQTKLRYMTPDDIAKSRSAAALDPQVRERLRAARNEGLEIARKLKPDEVVAKFDQSWWVTPGVVARNITGTQPAMPTDPVARATLMGDWSENVARVYAETLDKDKAIEKGTEITRTKWAASGVNGGKLMLYPPEKFYPNIGGSWAWMQRQLEADIAKTLGPRVPSMAFASGLVPGSLPRASYDWELVADRQTEDEAQKGRPPSYLVRITDHTKGGVMSILPQRYKWNSDAGPGNPTDAFERQRQRVLTRQQLDETFGDEGRAPFGAGLRY
jgi:hypothetical protein